MLPFSLDVTIKLVHEKLELPESFSKRTLVRNVY